LHGRTCSVVADFLKSQSVDLNCSLPQGSSLRPLKYVMYASGLRELTGRFGVKMHSFADDTQLSNTVFTRGDRRGDRSRDRSPRRSPRVNKHVTATARATVHATAVSPRIARIKHV